jgi:hypothetical protein
VTRVIPPAAIAASPQFEERGHLPTVRQAGIYQDKRSGILLSQARPAVWSHRRSRGRRAQRSTRLSGAVPEQSRTASARPACPQASHRSMGVPPEHGRATGAGRLSARPVLARPAGQGGSAPGLALPAGADRRPGGA